MTAWNDIMKSSTTWNNPNKSSSSFSNTNKSSSSFSNNNKSTTSFSGTNGAIYAQIYDEIGFTYNQVNDLIYNTYPIYYGSVGAVSWNNQAKS